MENIINSVQLLAELQTLLDVRKNFMNGTEINRIIADTAEEFVTAFNTKISDDEKPKSEMPCNCHEEFFAVPLQHIEDLRKNLEREFNQLTRELKMQKIRLNTFYKIK